ncbi:MAG: carboxypeptidase regulatory-like domain-containing protein [Alistipes sp.]|nr:carboxypeptidase regulatory-like domain-containing protein [Alistipes sp.]
MKRLLLTIALLLVVAVAGAQVTTSSVRGVVTDNDKNPIIGAAVVARHEPSGSTYGVCTNADGHYAINGMRVGGPYTIEISYLGYKTTNHTVAEMHVGEALYLDITLKEEYEVIDEITIVHLNHDVRTKNFNEKDMAAIPTVDRSIYDLTKLISSAVSPASGGIVLGGQSTRYNAFTIDGTSSADIYGLGTTGMTGSLTSANPIPIDAIREVEISTSTVDLRESGFTGGSINAVTRSGTNEFSGSAYTYFNNESFWGTTPGKDVAKRAKLSEQITNIYGLTLGGPIIKDKLHFFVAGEFNRGLTPSSNYPGSGVSALTLDEARQISERYEELTGYDGGGYGENRILEITGSAVARLDWNINQSNHLSLRYNMLYADADAGSNTAQSFYFTGSEYTNINRTHSVVAELNTSKDWGSNALRLGYTRLEDGRLTPESLPAVIINGLGEKGNGSATIGTSPYSGKNMLKQDVLIFGDDVSLNLGKHMLTFGTSNEVYRADNLYLANARGTYTYASLEDFLADNATQYAYGYFASGEKNPPMTMGQFALYAQDEYKISRELTLTYGLRADIPVMFDTPVANETFNNGYFAKHSTMTGDIPRVQILLSPRVGVEWFSDDKTWNVHGSAGIYTGRIPFVWLSNCYQNTGLRSVGVTVTNPAETPDFSLNPESVGIASNPSIDLVASDFRYPQVFRIAAGATYRYNTLKLSLDADYTKGINNIFVENLVAEDNGKRLFVGGEGSSTSATYYNAVTSDYAAVYRLSNTQRGYSWSVTARAEYDFGYELTGLRIAAAYTFAQSKSINDGVSAQASSNWGRNYAVNSNAPELSNSLYEFPHKVVGSISYNRRYGLFGTNVMLLYNGYSGEHYSLTYAKGKVDVNGDSYRGNSLIYIPTKTEMSTMLWADNTSAAAFNDYIESDKYLQTHRGKFAERNSHSLPFVHRLDLHIAQSFYFKNSGMNARKSDQRVELSLDVINLTNLLSRAWGLSYRTSNWTLSPVTVTELREVEGGYRPVYKFNGADYTINDLASRWHMQLGIRVVF